MTVSLVQGISRITAALTGLLLLYSIVFAMEAITTRVPVSAAYEIATETLLMLPWMLLFCSGVDEIGALAQRAWLYWVGAALGLAFIYYFERHTIGFMVTKTAMPLLAVAGGSLPHLIRRIGFVFTLCSLAAGGAGLAAFYWVLYCVLSGTRFATGGIAAPIVIFAATATASGVLAAISFWRTVRSRLRTWRDSRRGSS